MGRTGLIITAILCVTTQQATARTIYVDSRVGNNAYDGSSAMPLSAYIGPVRTLQRGMQLVQRGDSLVLTDNGTPYFGSLAMFGPRFSGTPGDPFRLIGNGAVISGTKPVAPQSWVEVGYNLWRITPIRKGWYQLVQNGAALPRIELPLTPGRQPDLPAGSWGVQRGAIYYKSEQGDNPRWHDFEIAERQTGLSLVGVRNVVISDITFRHFRADGINAHDRCEGVILDGVISAENGRAGIAIGGTSRVQIRNSRVLGNHEHSLLITELGVAAAQQTEFDHPPTIAE